MVSSRVALICGYLGASFYTIAIDGRYSIRLPGKLTIAFDGQTIGVQESDIKVVGKVILEAKLK